MSTSTAYEAVAVRRGVSSGALMVSFTASVFGSAFLLFSVQPMISRMILPRLGGSPAVWNVCVVFFQAALLLGYLYADLSASRLRPRNQVLLHAAVLLAGFSLLPLSFGTATPPVGLSPPLWLLGQLALAVGPPFVAISTTAPMLQSWFARTSHDRAPDPYFLYAASNTGSLLALLLYPVLIETTLGLDMQRLLWTAGYAVVAAGVLLSGGMMLASPGRAVAALGARALRPALPLGLPMQLRWIALAFLPSAMMLAVTTYISADVASAPLFWVLPLAIYIATFMLAFGRRQRATPKWLARFQAVALVLAAVMTLVGAAGVVRLGLSLGIALTAFGATAALCHLKLAQERPEVGHLTRYFLLISVGGVLGGLFAGLLAPMLFNGPWEYPILLLAAAAVRPATARAATALDIRPRAIAAMLLLGLVVVWAGTSLAPAAIQPMGRALWIVLPALASLLVFRPGRAFAVGIAGLLFLAVLGRVQSAEVNARSFFGTDRVVIIPEDGITVLEHGTTKHGVQGNQPGAATTPLGYYHRGGPFGRLMTVMDRRMPQDAAIDVLGLGTGGLACYARPQERWAFREIDSEVERLARDDRYFHFLAQCGNHPGVVLGDARITLEAEPDARYDLIILDVFTSDSVPAHLLTQEALAVYFGHLKPGGVVAFHVTNRYLDLAPVVARLAAAAGATARHIALGDAHPVSSRAMRSEVMVLAPAGGSLQDFADDGWDEPAAGPTLWTDDKSDIYSVIRWP